MTDTDQLSLDIRYVEYGKVFLENGATDFQILDYSDDEILVLAGRNRCEHFMDWGLDYPQQTSFSSAAGKVSVALLEYRQGYLFTQIQSRREGELSRSLGIEPRIDRPFNQVRFIYLTREQIENLFNHGLGLYSGLLYHHPRQSGAPRLASDPYALKDYNQQGRKSPVQLGESTFQALGNPAGTESAVRFSANALVAAYDKNTKKRQPLLIQAGGMSWLQRLEVIQQAQYYLLPVEGVITFALDHVTNQDVAIRLFDEAIPVQPPARTYILGGQGETFPDDYYASVAHLRRDQLYHPTLAVYLSRPLRTKNAVEIYELVEESQQMDDQRRFMALVKYHTLLKQTPPHLERVLGELSDGQKVALMSFPGLQLELYIRLFLDLAQKGWPVQDRTHLLEGIVRHYELFARDPDQLKSVFACLSPGEMCSLIGQVDQNALRQDLLRYAWEAHQGQLDRYAPFHVAIPSEKATNPVYTLLQDSIRRTRAQALKQIPANARPQLYRDLLKVRAEELQGNAEKSTRRLIHFFPADNGSADESVISYLLQVDEPDAVQALLNGLQAGDIHLLDDILAELSRLASLPLYERFLKWAPPSDNVYTQLLEKIVRLEMRSRVAQSPSLFQSILVFGRKLFGLQNAPSLLVASQVLQNSFETPLLKRYANWPHRAELEQTCLVATARDAAFAEWWLYAELGSEEQSVIEAHYPGWRQAAQSTVSAAAQLGSPGLQYLALGGAPPRGMSLRRACHEYQNEAINENLYNAVVNVWLETHMPFSPADITYMVNQLTGSREALLVRIVEDEGQATGIAGLSASVALKWLQATRKDGRAVYKSSEGKDRLYQRLHQLKNPDEVFIWEMLFVEDEAFQPSMSWGKYCNDCEYWQVHTRALNLGSDSRLVHYLELAPRLSDPFLDGRQPSQYYAYRRFTLKAMAEHRTGSLNINTLTNDNLFALLEFYHHEPDAVIRQTAGEIIAKFVLGSEFSPQLQSYSIDQLDEVRLFCEQNSLAEPLLLIDAEAQRRIGQQPNLALGAADKHAGTEQPGGVPLGSETSGRGAWTGDQQGRAYAPSRDEAATVPGTESGASYPVWGTGLGGGGAYSHTNAERLRHESSLSLNVLLWVSLVIIGLSLFTGLSLVVYIFLRGY